MDRSQEAIEETAERVNPMDLDPSVSGPSDSTRSDHAVDPLFFTRASALGGRDSAFCVVGKPFKKKRFGVAIYFCFILKGKNKIRKKKP